MQTGASFVSNVQTKLSTDPKNGFLLAYRKPDAVGTCVSSNPLIPSVDPRVACNTDRYFVWDPNSGASGAWILASSVPGADICLTSSCPVIPNQNNPILYRAKNPQDQTSSWLIDFLPSYSSKNMFTGVFLRSGINTDFDPNKTVTQ